MTRTGPRRQVARRAFAASAATTVVIAVASGLFGVIASRALGPLERGLLATATVWTSVLVYVGTVGLPQAVTYHVGRRPECAAAYTGTALAMAATGGVIVGGMGVVGALLLGGAARAPMAVLLASSAPMIITGCGIAAILGTGAYRAWSLLRPVGPLSALLAVIVVVSAGGDTALVIACVTAGSLIVHCAVVAVVVRRRGLWGRPNRPAARDLVSYGWRQLVSGGAWLLTYKLDQLYLSVAVAPAALGLYAVAASVGEVIVPVAASAGTIMLARVASGGGSEVRSSLGSALGFCVAIAAPMCLVGALAADELLSRVFGVAFLPAQDALRIYLGGALTLAVATVLADTLRGLGYPLDPAKADVCGGVLTVILLILLVPSYGIEGAAVASTASYTLVMIVLALLLRSRLRKGPAVG